MKTTPAQPKGLSGGFLLLKKPTWEGFNVGNAMSIIWPVVVSALKGYSKTYWICFVLLNVAHWGTIGYVWHTYGFWYGILAAVPFTPFHYLLVWKELRDQESAIE